MNMINKNSEFEDKFYFKIETRKIGWYEENYILFYTDQKFIQPNLSNEKLKKLMAAGKGYVGLWTTHDNLLGTKKLYTIVPLNRAHSYPKNIELEVLVYNGYALQI